MQEIKRANILSQALVHFVTARASLFIDQRMSGLPILVKWDDRCPSAWQHGLFFALFLCFQNNLLFALDFGHLPGRQLFELLPFFVHCCFLHPKFSPLGAQEWTCAQDYNDSTCWTPFQPCDLRDLSVESFPNVYSQIDELLRCMHALIFGFCWIRCRQVSLCQDVFSLQGTAASTGSSNFGLALLMVSLNSLSSGSMK